MVPADSPSPERPLTVRVVDGDFRGPAVQGKRGDRVLYVTWGSRFDDGQHGFHMFRRGKLTLDRADPAVVARAVEGGRTLVATVSLTDAKGGLAPQEPSMARSL